MIRPNPPASSSTLQAGAWLSVMSGVLMAVSAFLPWFTASLLGVTLNRNAFQLGANDGFSADGVILVVFGVITVLIGITRLSRSSMPRFVQRSPIITGIVSAAVAGDRIPSVNSLIHNIQNSDSSIVASFGIGLYLAFVAGGVSIIGGLVLRSKRNAPTLIPTANERVISEGRRLH